MEVIYCCPFCKHLNNRALLLCFHGRFRWECDFCRCAISRLHIVLRSEQLVVGSQFVTDFTKQRPSDVFVVGSTTSSTCCVSTSRRSTSSIVMSMQSLLRALHGPYQFLERMGILQPSDPELLASIRSRTCGVDIENGQHVGDANARISSRLFHIAIRNLVKRD
jgi:hypothetical protein